MARRKELTNKIARIENFFVEYAQYVLNPREQKIIIFLAANLDLQKEDFNEQTVSVKELESMLKRSDAKWGGIYKEMTEFAERIVGQRIKFPTDVLLNGKPLPGFITWFTEIVPCYNEFDEVCLRFRFNDKLKPFLLKLNQYVRIDTQEIAKLDSFYSLRLYQIFKANLSRQRKHRKISTKTFEVKELRQLLGAKGKYEQFKYFNRDILNKSTNEINEKTKIYLKYETLRTGRKITHVKYTFCFKEDHKEYKQLSLLEEDPIEEKNQKRTPAQRKLRRKQFDFDQFKKDYPLIFEQKRKESIEFYKGLKGVKMDAERINRSTSSLCEAWFAEFA